MRIYLVRFSFLSWPEQIVYVVVSPDCGFDQVVNAARVALSERTNVTTIDPLDLATDATVQAVELVAERAVIA